MKNYALISVLLLGCSSLVRADPLLSAQERTAFALLASVADIVAAQADASSCFELIGQYPISLLATGVTGGRLQDNMVTFGVRSPKGYVMGNPNQGIPEVGMAITTAFFPSASALATINSDSILRIKEYRGVYSFDSTDESLTKTSNLSLLKLSSLLELTYRATEITNFSPDSSNTLEDTNHTNNGWSMSALMNPEFPRSKFWNRFQITRDDGVNARTVLVSDLLSFDQSCRMKIDMSGHNGSDFLKEEGYLTIDLSEPGDPVDWSLN